MKFKNLLGKISMLNYKRAKKIWNFNEIETNFYEPMKMDYQKNSMFNIFANT